MGSPTDRESIPFIGCDAAGTLPGFFRRRLESSPDTRAYRQFEDGAWRDYSWAQSRPRWWRAGSGALRRRT